MQTLGKGSIAWWLKLLLDLLFWVGLFFGVAFLFSSVLFVATGQSAKLDVNLPVRFQLDEASYQVRSDRLGVEAGTIHKARGELKFKNPGGGFVAAFVAWPLLQLAILLIVLYQLRKLFAALAAKVPFDVANARRVRLMAFAILVGQAIGGLMTLGFTSQLKNSFATEGVTLTPAPNFNLGLIIFALVLLVIAEVFRIGAEMKAEQDLTV
jgi:hypothetical protein